MARLLTFALAAGLAALFGWFVPLMRLFDGFQPMIVLLSIMLAAVFVRLNRGFPTLEWKNLDPERRQNLTTQLVELARAYAWITAINAVALGGMVALTIIGKPTVEAWDNSAQRSVAAGVGLMIGLAVARMVYVVWRDYDIVKLQKALIDSAADRENEIARSKALNDTLSNIKDAALRRVGNGPARPWEG